MPGRQTAIAVSLLVACSADPGPSHPVDHAGHTGHEGHVAAPPHSAVGDRTSISIPSERAATFGIRVEPARHERIARRLRAVATVAPDESRVSHVHTRVSGWIERLYVDTTGERVRAGQPLASIFSQELLASQTEYLAARRIGGGPLVEGSRSRLKVFGMTDGEIAALERRGEPLRTVTIVAPRAGVVLHRGVAVGNAVDPSTEIVLVADLSTVWILGEIPEEAVPDVATGAVARLDFPSSGREPFEAPVDFLSPTLTERSRTLRARFVVANPDGRLRPGMYGSVELESGAREGVTVPRDAVVDRGESQHVFVEGAGGELVPRRVELGARLGDRVEVRSGLEAGERVVASGVFLVDSESRLRASGTPAGHAGHGGG